MNNSLILGDLKPKNYNNYIEDVEKRCRSLNRKHYFRYELDSDHAFVWTKRVDRRTKITLQYLDWEDNLRYCHFVDADQNYVERYVPKLPEFLEAFVAYCLWECPTIWV